ncbi:lycopene cyclase family protein [Chondrinema litorale]|uniref:lycopene cyclase family protein n=1 Tax=Chondrinema litorale TaxID=2994555 RepID=UPI0025427123|nr:lycopene cyclase family protein [Chondrinema litorale]UZR93782.1 lycopene cyclase family protein [Chondrinema litorale]
MNLSTEEEKADIIIAGAGAAGLLLAFQIAQEPKLSGKKVLLIDKTKRYGNDHTWCFWSKEKTPFDDILSNSWEELEFLSNSFQQNFNLQPYRYKMLKSASFYQFVWQKLASHPNIQFIEAEINDVVDNEKQVELISSAGNFYCDLLFDSRFSQDWIKQITSKSNLQLQHFLGYTIKTDIDSFDPETIRMFDFRIPQSGEVRFVYVLPLSKNEALIEFTVFSGNTLSEKTYKEVLENYISNFFNISDYRILEEEAGIIPMTDYFFERKNGDRIINIGTRGGLCKPSTGYAFNRMWQDAKHLVSELVKHEAEVEKINLKKLEIRYQIYDAMLLDIIRRDGGKISEIFTQMFKNNPIQRVFRFLDEETTFAEDFKVMKSVPSFPFFISIFNLFRNR